MGPVNLHYTNSRASPSAERISAFAQGNVHEAPSLEEMGRYSQAYQENADPQLKHQLVMNLNRILLSGNLLVAKKKEAIAIATNIGAQNLRVRLQAYGNHASNEVVSLFLPPEIMHLIISYALQGASPEEIMNRLRVSKGFNLALLSQPVNLNLGDFRDVLTDKELGALVALFPSMGALNLSMCYKITDAGLAPLKDLQQLTRLDLSMTEIRDAGLAHLKNLKQLTELNLAKTSIGDAGLVHLKDLTQLSTLYLSETKVTNEGLAHLKELKQLTMLSLHSTEITDEGLVHLQDLKQLTHLDLSRTNVTNTELARFKELKQLTELNLSQTYIEDAGLVHLKELKQLTMLSLDSTEITDEGLVHLKDLKQLEYLFLGSTNVTDAGVLYLSGLEQLARLDLGDTRITDSGRFTQKWILQRNANQKQIRQLQSILHLDSPIA